MGSEKILKHSTGNLAVDSMFRSLGVRGKPVGGCEAKGMQTQEAELSVLSNKEVTLWHQKRKIKRARH